MAVLRFQFSDQARRRAGAASDRGVKSRPPPLIPPGRFAFAHWTGGEQKSKQFLFKIQNACYMLSHSPDLAAARAAPAGEKGMGDGHLRRFEQGRREEQKFFIPIGRNPLKSLDSKK